MAAFVHITALCLTLLTLSGCGRMRAPDWGSSGSLVSSSGGTGGGTPPVFRNTTYQPIQVQDTRSCSLDEWGKLSCWGDNNHGQIRPPSEWRPAEVKDAGGTSLVVLNTMPSGTPVPHVDALKKQIVSLASHASLSHLCAIIGSVDLLGYDSGDVHCFGDPVDPTLLGSPGSDGKVPATPPGTRFIKVRTSDKVTCALSNANQLFCIGENPAWNPTTTLTDVPLPPGYTWVKDFAVGTNHICVILNPDNKLMCWGNNNLFQLGVQPNTVLYSVTDFGSNAVAPITIGAVNTFNWVYASDSQTCAIDTAEKIYCWGRGQTPAQVPTAPGWRVKSASLGSIHNCIVYDDFTSLAAPVLGKVQCGGFDYFGQLGRGSVRPPDPPSPPPVPDYSLFAVQQESPPTHPDLTGIVEVVAGNDFTCAVDTNHEVWCWGNNGNPADTSQQYFQLDQATPGLYTRAVKTRTNVIGTGSTRIAAGKDFQCVKRVSGILTCNGKNIFMNAQEGGGRTVFELAYTVMGPYFFGESPGPTATSSPFPQPLASNAWSTCASTQAGNGRLLCWGQFQDPDQTTPTLPAPKYPVPREIPFFVDGVEIDRSGISAVSLGGNHACAIRYGALFCWGSNSHGQIDGNTRDPGHLQFVNAPRLLFRTGVSQVSAGGRHTCAVVAEDLLCWGDNSYGQIGARRTSTRIPYPIRVMSGNIVSVSASDSHTCAILGQPLRLFCWGNNDGNRLGQNPVDPATYRDTPIPISFVPDFDPVRVFAGSDYTCAEGRHTSGTYSRLFCWGVNSEGKLGIDPNSMMNITAPLQASPDNLATNSAITTAATHVCYTIRAGTEEKLRCMGENAYAQLGQGYPEVTGPRLSYTPKTAFTYPTGRTVFAAAGTEHLCFSDGSVSCLGRNQLGQLGRGTTLDRVFPVPTTLFTTGVSQVAMGRDHTCTIRNSGELYCWGKNRVNASDLLLHAPLNEDFVVSLDSLVTTGVTQVVAFEFTTCISRNNEVRCWGQNLSGVLGEDPGTTPWLNYADAMHPSRQPIVTGNIRGLFLTDGKACALVDDILQCWGDNTNLDIDPEGLAGVIPPAEVSTGVTHAAVASWGICYSNATGLRCQVGPDNIPAVDLRNQITTANLASVTGLSISPWDPALCAWSGNGKLFCGGNNSSRTLNPAGPNGPMTFGEVHTDTTSFAMSLSHSCSHRDGSLKCWGQDGLGQLGNGDEDFLPQFTPAPVEFP